MATASVQAPRLDYNAPKLFEHASSSLKQNDSPVFHETLSGFPSRYTGERVWVGSEMASKQDQWITLISEQEQTEILKALRHFQNLNLGPESLSPDTFPLSEELDSRLKNISYDCYNGRGFGVLRGVRTENLTDEEKVIVFAGVSTHVAPTRGFQDIKRELVTCHVISEDNRPRAKEQNLKPAFTNGRLAFHTDLGDILALYAMNVSNTGGNTMIVSSSQIYNELAETRPDMLQELGKPWAFYHSQNYDTDGTPLVTNAVGDKLVFQFSRLPITGFRSAGANPTLPPPTEKRLEAMSLVEELAWKNCLALPGQPGDVAFINNLCLMHARSAFDLDAEGNPLPSKRHLVKLMLRDPELTWDLPESLGWYSERIYGSNQDDGGRTEKFQLSIKSDESLPDGHIWAGAGSLSNG